MEKNKVQSVSKKTNEVALFFLFYYASMPCRYLDNKWFVKRKKYSRWH